MKLPRDRIDRSRYDIGGEDMRRIGIRIPQEVGEGHGGEGVVIGKGGLVEFDHYRYRRCICECVSRAESRDEKVVFRAVE